MVMNFDTMKGAHPTPRTRPEWLKETAIAYKDAAEALPFARLLGDEIGHKELFHFAPAVCLKFRGIRKTKANIKKATEAALSSYVATEDKEPTTLCSPHRSFAFCYIASHLGLDLLTEAEASKIIDYVFKKDDRLLRLIREN